MIKVYTDGAARGNPGPGGYGIVLISEKHGLRKELCAGFRKTTNNRMELLAVIVALETLKIPKSEVLIYSDSSYVVNAIEKGWLTNWVKINFKNKKNADLWMRYLRIAKHHQVKLKWVKGHAGNPNNERCDELAVYASKQPSLPADVGYESAN